MFDVGCQMSDVRCRMSDVGCRMSDVRCRMSDVCYVTSAGLLYVVTSTGACPNGITQTRQVERRGLTPSVLSTVACPNGFYLKVAGEVERSGYASVPDFSAPSQKGSVGRNDVFFDVVLSTLPLPAAGGAFAERRGLNPSVLSTVACPFT
jgi:hypothetical protein